MSKIMDTYTKIEKAVTGTYAKIENAFVSAYKRVEDAFVAKVLARNGESIEQAKERIQLQQAELEQQNRTIVEKSTHIPK